MPAGAAPVSRLPREWAEKLRASGFRDIEYPDGSLRVACRENRGLDPLEYESRVEYYSRASEVLHRYPWRSELDRSVWSMHADGATLREIGRAHGHSERWAHAHVHAIERETSLWWDGTHRHVRRWERGGDEELARLRAEVTFRRRRRAAVRAGQLPLPLAW